MIDLPSALPRKPIVVLLGPTAVGKSALAVQLARVLGTEVLAADSRQVYRGMDIATDKPSMQERNGIPHGLIDVVNPDEPFNAGLYRRAADREIARLHGEGKLPLIVGGTGLYIRALVGGLCEGPGADPAIRAALREEVEHLGAEALHRRLAGLDPVAAARLHPNDRVKVMRALEVHAQTGRPLSALQAQHGFATRSYAALLIGLQRERDDLYARIEGRIEMMLARGVVEEAKQLLAWGYDRQLGSMKGLGYKQLVGYLAGEYDYEEAVRRLKRDTRHFAKRQLTWFRKEPGITWLSLAPTVEAPVLLATVMDRIGRFLADLGSGGRRAAVPQEGT